MTDNHIHIGQFENIYYDPFEITDIVMSSGIEGMSFTSTSSCIEYIKYQDIEKEISIFLSNISYKPEIIRPFLWYIPDYIYQNISLESAFTGIPYKGIKLHPYINNWDFKNVKHMNILHNIFNLASTNNIPILIHTGLSSADSADRFEYFFNEYKEALCILAHCRPLEITLKMLRLYKNIYCDTAFSGEKSIRKIISAGFYERIIFGSDFPITHFYNMKYKKTNKNISLKDSYAKDISIGIKYNLGSNNKLSLI